MWTSQAFALASAKFREPTRGLCAPRVGSARPSSKLVLTTMASLRLGHIAKYLLDVGTAACPGWLLTFRTNSSSTHTPQGIEEGAVRQLSGAPHNSDRPQATPHADRHPSWPTISARPMKFVQKAPEMGVESAQTS